MWCCRRRLASSIVMTMKSYVIGLMCVTLICYSGVPVIKYWYGFTQHYPTWNISFRRTGLGCTIYGSGRSSIQVTFWYPFLSPRFHIYILFTEYVYSIDRYLSDMSCSSAISRNSEICYFRIIRFLQSGWSFFYIFYTKHHLLRASRCLHFDAQETVCRSNTIFF